MTQSLSARHLLMIALGSAIGTGLFFSSANAIKLTGPAIILSYMIGGLIMYFVVRSLGEMLVHEPNIGSLSYYAYKYLGSYAGFVSGWNYWFNYIIVCMLELTASTFFLDYWFKNTSHWLTIAIIIAIFTVVNLISIKFFAEFEFWFTGIKVSTIIIFIILASYLVISNSIHNDPIINIHNLWDHHGANNSGFFTGGATGFLFSFVIVIFSFGGTELIGVAAAETKNHKQNIPRAINGIIFRIVIFYISTLTLVICLYPWNLLSSNISPFVDVFQKIGMSNAASIINFVALSAALSSFNSGIYGTARILCNLSIQNNAPKVFNKKNPANIPYTALIFSVIIILFTVLLNYLYPKQIFGVLLAIATISAIINWIIILITHIKFKNIIKTQGIKSDYKTILYPYSSLIAIIFFISIIIIMCFMKDMQLAVIIAPIWLLILTIAYRVNSKTKNIINKVD